MNQTEILSKLQGELSMLDAKIETLLDRAENKRWLSIEELLEYLPQGWPKQTIYEYARARKIPHIKKGKRLIFDRIEIDEWLDSSKVKTSNQLKDELYNSLGTTLNK